MSGEGSMECEGGGSRGPSGGDVAAALSPARAASAPKGQLPCAQACWPAHPVTGSLA